MFCEGDVVRPVFNTWIPVHPSSLYQLEVPGRWYMISGCIWTRAAGMVTGSHMEGASDMVVLSILTRTIWYLILLSKNFCWRFAHHLLDHHTNVTYR